MSHVVDGIELSRRKILCCCLKRGLCSKIKVAQLAGCISGHAAYHCGEASLNSAITGVARNFVGSGNLNLLVLDGRFRCRLSGWPGRGSASMYPCVSGAQWGLDV